MAFFVRRVAYNILLFGVRCWISFDFVLFVCFVVACASFVVEKAYSLFVCLQIIVIVHGDDDL